MKTVIATALMLVAGVAGAHDVSVSDAAELPVTSVKTLYSVPGETRTEFVKRVAPEFSTYTAETGFEACGVIAVLKDGADGVRPTFSIKVGTIGSQIGCAGSSVEDGYTSMGATIHSHPQKRVIRLSAVDMKVRGTPAGKLRTENVNNCEFSAQDYTQPGYLVTCGKVLYQSGRGTDKEI